MVTLYRSSDLSEITNFISCKKFVCQRGTTVLASEKTDIKEVSQFYGCVQHEIIDIHVVQ